MPMLVRTALMHVTGDKDNNITTGANRAFTDELIGYNLINGVYSLNNAGKDVIADTRTPTSAPAAYRGACRAKAELIGVYNYETGEITLHGQLAYIRSGRPAFRT